MSIEDDLIGMLTIAKRHQAAIEAATAVATAAAKSLDEQAKAMTIAIASARGLPADALAQLQGTVGSAAAAGIGAGLGAGQKALEGAVGRAVVRIDSINGTSFWRTLFTAALGVVVGGAITAGGLVYAINNGMLRPVVPLDAEAVAGHIEQFLKPRVPLSRR